MKKKKLYSESKTFDQKIGNELKRLRLKTSYRQIDVAKKMNKSVTTISDYEAGKTVLTLGAFMDYCEAIGEDYIKVWNEFHYKQKFKKTEE